MVTDFQQLSPDIQGRLAKVKLLLMDVDGVLTNGKIRIDDHGVESKEFSTRDGYGFHLSRKYGLKAGVISGRASPATEVRCKTLHFDEIHLGRLEKFPVLEEIVHRTGIAPHEILYVGDDLIDLPVMKAAGLSAAPSDSHEDVLKQVSIVLAFPGGAGAVRQVIDFWLKATGQWEKAIQEILHGY